MSLMNKAELAYNKCFREWLELSADEKEIHRLEIERKYLIYINAFNRHIRRLESGALKNEEDIFT